MIDPAATDLVAERTMSLLRRARAHFVLLALASSVLVRCSCEEDPVFVPGVVYEPDQTLNFGEVAVDREATLSIRVISNGGAALKISQLTFPGETKPELDKLAFENQICAPDAACTALKPELLAGIAPNTTSSISVTYRPCPAAWDGDTIKPDFDFAACPSTPDEVTMVINDNSREQTHTITITGQPALQPQIKVFCNRSGSQCNQPINAAAVTECNSLSFGSVTAGETPCDIELELRNLRRNGPTGPLHVERLDLYVTNLSDLTAQRDGREVGFSFLDEGGQPLALPIEVPIAVGATMGSKKIKVRFNGSGNGEWFGAKNEGRGLRIYHDDPDPMTRPVVGITTTAIGAAPQITVLPAAIDFGPVQQNTSRTATVVVGNAGSAELRITDIRFATDNSNSRFRASNDRGANPPPAIAIGPNTFAGLEVYVTYTPLTAGQDSDELLIGSNDPDDNPVRIRISGGATPRINVQPRDIVVFELENPPPPPPAPARERNITVSNVGYGDLVIQRLDMIGPDDERAHPSIDDFSVAYGNPEMRCTTFPCDVNIRLCPASDGACADPTTLIRAIYQNNDNSTTDLATLLIYTTDPANPVYPVVLNAEDRPCFSPSPVVTLETANPSSGSEVCVNCNATSPGGPPGMPATIQSCTWAFDFAASSPIPTFTPNPGARACFTPTSAGLHIVSLNVTNSCGVAGSPANEVITVRAP